jgi:hypothetical protein
MTAFLSKYAIGAFLAATLIGGLFYAGYRYAQDGRELDDARDYIEGTQDADKATDDVRRVGACGWLRETFGGEGCGTAGPDAPAD